LAERKEPLKKIRAGASRRREELELTDGEKAGAGRRI